MVQLRRKLHCEQEKLAKACPGYRSENCSGKKLVNTAQEVLVSLTQLNTLLQTHLNETNSISEQSTCSTIKGLSRVQEDASGLLNALTESKYRAKELHVNAAEQIKESDKQLSAMESYNNLRKAQIENDTRAITEVVALIKGLKPLTDLIQDISAEIKTLSLNAVIQAARAGEVGRSFAVVAHEMKNLTRQCEEASLQVEMGIQEVNETVNTRLVTVTDAQRNAREEQWLGSMTNASTKTASEFQVAVREFDLLSQNTHTTVKSISSSVLKVLEQAQFQDISRQQIEQVQAGLTLCSKQMNGVVALLVNEGVEDWPCLSADDAFKSLQLNYTMQSQRVVHESVLNSGDPENSGGRPMIELF